MRSLDPASDPPDILNPHGGPPYRVMSRAVMAARIREQSEHYSLTITKLSSLYALLTHSTPPGLAGMNLYILFIFVSKIYIKTPLASFQNKHAPGSSPASRTGRQCCYSCRAAGRPTKKGLLRALLRPTPLYHYFGRLEGKAMRSTRVRWLGEEGKAAAAAPPHHWFWFQPFGFGACERERMRVVNYSELF